MTDAIKLICEQLRNNPASIGAKESAWRTLIGRVFSDTEGVYTDDERNELREAAKAYDRAKLLADTLELLASPVQSGKESSLSYDEGFYGRGIVQMIADAKLRPTVTSTPYITPSTLTATTLVGSSQ